MNKTAQVVEPTRVGKAHPISNQSHPQLQNYVYMSKSFSTLTANPELVESCCGVGLHDASSDYYFPPLLNSTVFKTELSSQSMLPLPNQCFYTCSPNAIALKLAHTP